MDLTSIFDVLVKSAVGLSGIGLIGLLIVRTDARGRWKLVDLQPASLFDKKMDQTGRTIGLVFMVCVLLAVVRTVSELYFNA